jgi:hypothetical protein
MLGRSQPGQETIMRRVFASVWTVILICFASVPLGTAAAEDLKVENYKRTVEKLVSNWAAAEIALSSKLVPVLQELEQKRKIASPSDADKARIGELIKQRDSIRDKMDEESANLRLELIIVEVQPGAPDNELVQLPGWMTGIIKAKGVPVGHGVTLVPEASFDFKKLKLKSFSAGLRFNWG